MSYGFINAVYEQEYCLRDFALINEKIISKNLIFAVAGRLPDKIITENLLNIVE